MTLESGAKFEGKLTFAFKNDMSNLRNFHQSTWMSQNSDFDRILLSKVEDLLGSYASWEWRMVQKLKRKLKSDMNNLTNFDSSTQKSKKIAL